MVTVLCFYEKSTSGTFSVPVCHIRDDGTCEEIKQQRGYLRSLGSLSSTSLHSSICGDLSSTSGGPYFLAASVSASTGHFSVISSSVSSYSTTSFSSSCSSSHLWNNSKGKKKHKWSSSDSSELFHFAQDLVDDVLARIVEEKEDEELDDCLRTDSPSVSSTGVVDEFVHEVMFEAWSALYFHHCGSIVVSDCRVFASPELTSLHPVVEQSVLNTAHCSAEVDIQEDAATPMSSERSQSSSLTTTSEGSQQSLCSQSSEDWLASLEYVKDTGSDSEALRSWSQVCACTSTACCIMSCHVLVCGITAVLTNTARRISFLCMLCMRKS